MPFHEGNNMALTVLHTSERAQAVTLMAAALKRWIFPG